MRAGFRWAAGPDTGPWADMRYRARALVRWPTRAESARPSRRPDPGHPGPRSRAATVSDMANAVPETEPLHRALGLTDDELASVESRPGPGAQPPRARPLRRHVERALLLQVVAAAPPPPADRGGPGAGRPGGERRGDRRRRRHRRGHPHREPQPPLGHRALPGGGHRGRGDPARHLHHGGPAAGRDGPALLRTARRPPPALADGGGGGRASPPTATRSACPPSAASSPSTPATPRTPWSTCCAWARCRWSAWCWAGPRARATWPCCWARPPGATASAG